MATKKVAPKKVAPKTKRAPAGATREKAAEKIIAYAKRHAKGFKPNECAEACATVPGRVLAPYVTGSIGSSARRAVNVEISGTSRVVRASVSSSHGSGIPSGTCMYWTKVSGSENGSGRKVVRLIMLITAPMPMKMSDRSETTTTL